MSNYKPIDLSKEDFRKYLDRQGVLDAITKVLVKCNSERPENALAYVVENLNETHGNTKTQLFEAQQEIERLKKEISALKVEDKTVPGAMQEPEIDTAATSNGGEVEMKMETNKSSVVGEAVVADVKQERDAVVPSPAAERSNDATKPNENPASSGNAEVQEPAAVAAAAASPNDAPDAKEPSTNDK